MECRRCGRPTTMVKERRGERRRRECPDCGTKHRFTTYEIYARPFKGTSLGYKRDRATVARGEANGRSYMTVKDVIEIRRLYHVEEMTGVDISKKLKVPTRTINGILSGKSWAWVPHQDYELNDKRRTYSGRAAKPVLKRITNRKNVNKITAQGEDCHFRCLTERSVIEIRRLHDVEGMSPLEIIDHFKDMKLSYSNTTRIVQRKTWAHVHCIYDLNDFYPLG